MDSEELMGALDEIAGHLNRIANAMEAKLLPAVGDEVPLRHVEIQIEEKAKEEKPKKAAKKTLAKEKPAEVPIEAEKPEEPIANFLNEPEPAAAVTLDMVRASLQALAARKDMQTARGVLRAVGQAEFLPGSDPDKKGMPGVLKPESFAAVIAAADKVN